TSAPPEPAGDVAGPPAAGRADAILDKTSRTHRRHAMPFNLGAPELIIILPVFILLFGARKLPDLRSSAGKSIRNFKKGLNEAREEEEADDAEARVDTPVPPSSTPPRQP